MSWLSKMFSKLFNHQPDSKPVRPRVRKAAGPRPEQTSASEGTLGWLLKKSPSIAPFMAYDLSKPHSIEPDKLGHLRRNIHTIPPMPETWRQIQNILQQPDASAGDLGAIIATDPVLTAQILKSCNASAYATSGSSDINNIPLAIARLGLDETSNIIFQTLAPKLGHKPETRVQTRYIWMHSQAISSLMRVLAEPCNQVSRHDASLIGMLHDIGKLVILHIEDGHKLAELKTAINGGLSTLEAEHQLLGYTHIDAGVMLALHWQLPRHVQNFISLHHHAASLPVANIPSQLQHSMMMLNLAHMVLQQAITTDNEVSSIWSDYQRVFAERPESFVKRELNLPLDSPTLFEQLGEQIERIKTVFPDLYPVEDGS